MAALGSKLSRLSNLIGPTESLRFRELLGVLWDNKNELPYAWSILNRGVCDGCSLGLCGLRENGFHRAHLCTNRLKLLKLNTMGPLKAPVLGDVERLRGLSREKLRRLGRLPYPMMRRSNQKGFVRIGWPEAFELIGRSTRATAASQMGFLVTSPRLTNEVFYVVQKLARALGTNNVDICPEPCYRASINGLKNTLGLGASTCSLKDMVGTDLVVLFGIAGGKDRGVKAQYIDLAKQHGTRVVAVHAVRQNGVEAGAAAAGAQLDGKTADDLFRVNQGGDVAFINGALKALIAANQLDADFISKHTTGLAQLKAALEQQSWQLLEQRSGAPRAAMEYFARIYGEAKSAVFIYNTAPSRHELFLENVQAVVNLALARGMIGRTKCGILASGGHAGAGECGALPDNFPGGLAVNQETARRFSNLWRHPVPSASGLNAAQMIEAAHCGTINFLYCIGENLLEVISNRSFAAEAVARVPFRVHQDIVMNSSMLLDARDIVLLLPSQTRYEQRSGGTVTNTERRIQFTPEIPGHHIGESLPDWEIPALIGRKAMPNGELLFPFNETQSIREEMARVIPIYRGIEKLNKEGDELQWGGPFLYGNGFSEMLNNRARFTVLEPLDRGPQTAGCISDPGS